MIKFLKTWQKNTLGMDITKLEKGDFMNIIDEIIIFAAVLTVIGFILQGILKYMDKKDLDKS